MTEGIEKVTDPEKAVLREILASLRQVEFGSVLIKIHHGEVVGIETSTKVRLKGSEKTA
jgi:hypothetical protein